MLESLLKREDFDPKDGRYYVTEIQKLNPDPNVIRMFKEHPKIDLQHLFCSIICFSGDDEKKKIFEPILKDIVIDERFNPKMPIFEDEEAFDFDLPGVPPLLDLDNKKDFLDKLDKRIEHSIRDSIKDNKEIS
ncbi:MAG: hypothetical protein NMK33_04075 [Candidatus Cardinium sp.]|uniref:hypothetical protein n=1 Tax=Cardinium endosymbiont of Dermatophagoides farinae TaxID=2597823 RepID=UPI001182C2B8|nr:hypothetical protein [Cardinium endosymbiont of Dermatophagoides farinae]TSJ80616.1 hypothetical protein FPG78_00800 [Cardinium endosymbiont of Dermatophagoides farinae]UWW96608.1 MAG: hypothetical protein NMK33_04075 [Candidatus Cardinium sp.]